MFAGDELDDHDAVNVNVDFCYSVRDLPQSYTEAVHSPESQNWRNAMDKEMHSLKENDTFTLTPLPEGKQTVGAEGYMQLRRVQMELLPIKQGMLQRVIVKLKKLSTLKLMH